MSLSWYFEHGVDYLLNPLIVETSTVMSLYNVPARYTPQIALLIDQGVLGKDAQEAGWDNIGEHCIYAGKLAETIATLVGMSDDDSLFVTRQAYIHDAQLRRDKEDASLAKVREHGLTQAKVGNGYYRTYEMAHPDIQMATSMDWRGYQDWPLSMKIMRYVDSCIGPVLLPDHKTCGRDKMQHWSMRSECLTLRKRAISEQVGNELYNGTPAFVYLEGVVSDIEDELYEHAITSNPQLFTRADHPEDFYTVLSELVGDQIPQLPYVLEYNTV